MGTWISTVTNKGYALQAKLLSTDKLNVTRVVSGSGSCAVTQLINQTAVTNIKQELTLDSLGYDTYGNARLKVILSNIGLTSGYDVSQIGIYATDPDEGEILYAIAQADEAEPIPSISEQPNGFYCAWDFSLTYSNAQNVNVTIDPSNAISREAADLRYIQLAKIGEGLEFDENGNLKAKAQALTVDDTVNKDSTNPVQNKAVYVAIENSKYTHPSHDAQDTGFYKIEVDSKGHVVSVTAVGKSDIAGLGFPSTTTMNTLLAKKVDVVDGKALSTNDYTTAEKNKLSGIATGANKYTHPAYTSQSAGFYKVTVDDTGHVSDVTAVQKSDITALGIPAQYVGTGIDATIFNYAFNVASGNYSHSEGLLTEASGDASHSEGCKTKATYSSAHAEGDQTVAEGFGSHSEGCNTTAKGDYSHAGGYGTIANECQYAVGCYNKEYAGRYSESVIYTTYDGPEAATAFVIGCGTSDTARANALRTTTDGKTRGLQAFLSSGADFAEYMEWEDGNPDNEDRRGRMVAYALTDAECVVEEIEIVDPVTHEKKTVEAVVREKMPPIRYATSFDECIGVVSSSGAFIGNSASEEWNSRYVRDIFGEKIVQAVLIPEETKTYNTIEIDKETGEEVTVEKTEVIPEHWVNQYVLNPHYDPEAEYIEREHRKEWSPVGFHGQIVAVDDGTCVVGGYCSPAENGIATASETGFRVIQRLDRNHVRLYVE